MNKIKDFKKLKVWIISNKLSLEVSKLVKTFPRDEKFDLAGQMRRAARSIPSEISEGFSRFHFNDKLTFYERARASLDELYNHFDEALANKYIDQTVYLYYARKMDEIGFLLNRMMSKIKYARDTDSSAKRSLPVRRTPFQREALPSSSKN
jgi:four helix bundle protein